MFHIKLWLKHGKYIIDSYFREISIEILSNFDIKLESNEYCMWKYIYKCVCAMCKKNSDETLFHINILYILYYIHVYNQFTQHNLCIYIYFADSINITLVCAGQTEKYTVKFMLLSVRNKRRRKFQKNIYKWKSRTIAERKKQHTKNILKYQKVFSCSFVVEWILKIFIGIGWIEVVRNGTLMWTDVFKVMVIIRTSSTHRMLKDVCCNSIRKKQKISQNVLLGKCFIIFFD